MIILNRRLFVFLKFYVAAALIVAAVFSPASLSIIPVLLLAWYLLIWRWRFNVRISLLTECFVLLALVLLLFQRVSYFSLLIAAPSLALVERGLRDAAVSMEHHDSKWVRSLTKTSVFLLVTIVVLMILSLLLGNLQLFLATAMLFVFLVALGVVIFKRFAVKPVKEVQVQQRMIAGSTGDIVIEINTSTRFGGLLFVDSPYEWLKVKTNTFVVKDKLGLKISLTPPLSGPSVIKLKGYATDCWGLSQTRFELEPVQLYVVPRARYAEWIAKKYMAGVRSGILPLLSNLQALKPIFGLRRGIEYYGSQLYQPGDSLKNIDWKHSIKYNEMITKEFAEFHGQPAVILINLAAGNEEEADVLAYNIIATALTLAKENIPAALAVYNSEEVKRTTGQLPPGELVLNALQIAKEIVMITKPVRYLSPVDVGRLRANISRIRNAESQAAKVLLDLMQIEYKNLSNDAKVNPATRALNEVVSKIGQQSGIIIISSHNHDTEALAFNSFSFSKKGNAVISI